MADVWDQAAATLAGKKQQGSTAPASPAPSSGGSDVWGQAESTFRGNPKVTPAPTDGSLPPQVGEALARDAKYIADVTMQGDDEGPDRGFLENVKGKLAGLNPFGIAKGYANHMNHPFETASGMPGGGIEDVPFVQPAVEAGMQAASGNVKGALGTATGTGLQAAALVGAPKLLGAASKATGILGGAEDALKNTISDKFSPAEHDPAASILTKSLRGSVPSGRVGFTPNLKRSMPLVKEAEGVLGKPIETVDDLIGEDGRSGAIGLAKQANRSKFNELMKSKGEMGMQVDGSPIANAMEGSITKKMMVEDPAKVDKIKTLADSYRKKFSVEDLDELLQNHNAELDSYYAKNPSARKAAQSNPDTALTVAQAEATRKALYNALDGTNMGEAARELQRNYGSLSELQEAFQKRKNVALRQAPDSLSEQLSKWDAAKNGLNGLAKIVTSPLSENPGGKFGSGLMDIGSGLAETKAAKWVKDWQSTDGMVRRAFKNYSQKPAVIGMPASFKPAGLLEAGPAGRTENSTGARFNMPGETPYSQNPMAHQGIDPEMAARSSSQRLLGAGPERVIEMSGDTPYSKNPIPHQGIDKQVGWNNRNSGKRLLGAPTQHPQGGFAVSEEMVPVTSPVTGKIEYLPRWMTQKVKVDKP